MAPRRWTSSAARQVISSGTEDTAAAQIPSIQAAIADQADAIVIAGNDPDALCPSLQQAQDAGIVVVAFDSDVSCADHLFINQAETNNIGTAEVDYMATLLDGKGEVAILSAAATATNQNAWIEAMKTQFEKYPDMKLVDVVYGNDDPATSLTVLQGCSRHIRTSPASSRRPPWASPRRRSTCRRTRRSTCS